jgi:hypothetical protein
MTEMKYNSQLKQEYDVFMSISFKLAHGQKNRYELFHLYLKCVVSFYGMVNVLGEEKNGR